MNDDRLDRFEIITGLIAAACGFAAIPLASFFELRWWEVGSAVAAGTFVLAFIAVDWWKGRTR